MSKFWVVWQPGNGAPRVKHPSEKSALNEAKRLAAFERGKPFYVLEAISVSETSDVVTHRLERTEEPLPF